MSRRMWLLVGAVIAVAAIGGSYLLSQDDGDYRVQFVVPSAAQLVEGSFVWIDGREAGEVSRLEARDGKAIVTAKLDNEYAPLREGTITRVEWQSVLGERILTIDPGPDDAAPIPDGALYAAESTQIEVDQVLAALDEPTRERLSTMLQDFAATVDGNEEELQETLTSAGPALSALGEVLEAVGRDGPAIRSMVTELTELTAALTSGDEGLADVVTNLTTAMKRIAPQHQELGEGLALLPSTLSEAHSTLDAVPDATDATIPLLQDLEPATAQLASTSTKLQPVLQQLRPSIAQLRPVLKSARAWLGETPALFDRAHGVVPHVGSTLDKLQPAVSYLRPYTPEAVGWVHNWGLNYASYDAEGHVWLGGLAQVGASALNAQPPGGLPPLTVDEPVPGEVVDQPWTDAHGSEIR